ncbi:cholinesterase-like [Neosynchiropus ocellatus]
MAFGKSGFFSGRLLHGFSMACRYLALILCLHHLGGSLATADDDLLINTKNGKVQGTLLPLLGGDVKAFLGIPYAKPPVGKLRFTAPQPVEKWDGVKDATKFPNSCYQMPDSTQPGFRGTEMWNPNTPLSEDCLYLNVWSPRLNKTQLQASPLAPVLVWIYGGGFISGTSSLDVYDGRYLSKSESVVVVSMNYRVGAFGFLTLPDNKNIKGDAGLLDQRMALQWVADNIAFFGGDPSKVTLFGESAGSASVGLHLLSPGSQSLFQRAIMQSGSPNAPWATLTKDASQKRSVMLAGLIGCPTSPAARMEMCLQKADPKAIASKQFGVLDKKMMFGIAFTPLRDGDFLPDHLEMLLQTSKFPKKDVMFGLNRDEGTYFLFYGLPGFSLVGQSLITRNDFLHGVSQHMGAASDLAKQAVITQYTDWTDESSKMKNRDSMAQVVGDHMFACPLLEFARRYSQHGGKSFLYFFDHVSSINPWPAWTGAMHGYEIEFVFGLPLNATWGYTKNEVNMTKKFMKHWGNFARAGDPGIDGASWPKFTADQQEYVTLNQNHPEQKTMLKVQECQLWNKLIPQMEQVTEHLAVCLASHGNAFDFNWTLLISLLFAMRWF